MAFVELDIDTAIYPASAVNETVAAYADVAAIAVSESDAGMRVRLTPKDGCEAETVGDEFMNFLLARAVAHKEG